MPKKLTYEFVKEQFEKEGYTLISKEYKDSKTKLEYICPSGHKGSIRFDNWKQGKRCAKCSRNVKLTVEFIREQFEEEDYTLLTAEYRNNMSKLYYVCPHGHEHYISWGNWKQGYRCPYCSGKVSITIEYILAELLKENYELLSDSYIDAHSHLEVKCPKGHVYHVNWNNWNSGKRCPICPAQQSKFEKEVRAFLDSLHYEYVTNDRTQVKNPITNRSLELDIYFPDINKAIECNGDYWHSNDVVVCRDRIKKKQCGKIGIDLLVVTDTDWYIDSSTVKTTITNFIGKTLEV